MGAESPNRVRTQGGAVFLSYASQDAEATQRICDALRAAGIEVWFDKSELRGGDAWDRQIRKQIHECTLFVPVISAHSDARREGYFRREWKLAVDRTHDMSERVAFVLPVVIDDTSDSQADVPDRFREVQWTRLPGGETTSSFIERVGRLLSPDAQAAPAPASMALSGSKNALAARKPARLPRRSMSALLAVGVTLAVAISYVVVDKFGLFKHTATTDNTAVSSAIGAEKSIAVLPFVDLSEKHDQEYFADGLAEEISSLLSTLPDLKVISRTSSFQFKGQNPDLRTIGAQLGAAYVVEGSVRHYRERVRVTAQLISTSNGVHRWSENYERNIGDILKMQQDIATALGRALQVEVGAVPWEAASVLTSTEAYTSYLRGLHALDQFDKAGFEEAVGYFEHSLTMDPGLLRARESLALTEFLQYAFGFVEPAVGADVTRRDIDRILKEDPRSATGHALRARLLTTYDWDWVAAQREADLALSLAKTNYVAIYAAADLAGVLGQWDKSVKLFREALTVDPLDADTRAELASTLYRAGRFAEAQFESRRLLEIRPSFSQGHFGLGLVLLAQKEPQAAMSEMDLENDAGFRLLGVAMASYALGRKADSDAALYRAEHDYGQVMPYQIACVHAFRSEADAAFQWLDRAYAYKDYLIQYIKGEWALKSLEGDPRYTAFLRKMNLPE